MVWNHVTNNEAGGAIPAKMRRIGAIGPGAANPQAVAKRLAPAVQTAVSPVYPRFSVPTLRTNEFKYATTAARIAGPGFSPKGCAA